MLLFLIPLSHKTFQECFVKAKEATGLYTEVTGAMGKRIKYQTQDSAQLLCVAYSRPDPRYPPKSVAKSTSDVSEQTAELVNDFINDDGEDYIDNIEGIYSAPKFTHLTPDHGLYLSSIDQCILLGLWYAE